MEQRPDPNASPQPRRVSPRLVVAAFITVGFFGLLFQVNRLLSTSFRLELFGEEILEVENLDAKAHETPELRGLRDIHVTGARSQQTDAEPEVFVVVEQMPELIGGLAGISKNIRYPEVAREAGVEGRVIVQFIVDERGRVTEPRVVRGIGGGCDEEALRVLELARFKPGKQHGKTVKVKMSIPITFKLLG